MLNSHSSSRKGRKIKQKHIDLYRERTKDPQSLGSPFCVKNNPNSRKPNSQWIKFSKVPPRRKMGISNNSTKLTKAHKRITFISYNYMISVWSRWDWRYPCELQRKTEATKNVQKKQWMMPNPHLLHSSPGFLLCSMQIPNRKKGWDLHQKCFGAISDGYQKPLVQPRRFILSYFAAWQTTGIGTPFLWLLPSNLGGPVMFFLCKVILAW